MKWIFDFRQMCDLWHTTEHEYAFLETFFTLQPRKHRTQWNISFSWRSFVFFLLAPADFSIFMNESLINLSTDTVDCHYSRYWNQIYIFTISIELEFSSDKSDAKAKYKKESDVKPNDMIKEKIGKKSMKQTYDTDYWKWQHERNVINIA